MNERPPTFPRQDAASQRAAVLLVWGLLVLLSSLSGCAAFRPIEGVPPECLPDELRVPSRSGKATIDLSLLRQTPPPRYLVDSGDVLGVYIEGVLGQRGEVPPVHFPEDREVPPSLGYPIPVREDGTISLPLVGAIDVRGMSIREVEEAVRRAYTQDREILQPGRDRIFVSLQTPRTYRVLVIRQEAGNDFANLTGQLNLGTTKRGTGQVVNLPAYKNDVLNALAETGGLPGLDAENAIYIIRRRPSSHGPVPAPPGSWTAPGGHSIGSGGPNAGGIQQTSAVAESPGAAGGHSIDIPPTNGDRQFRFPPNGAAGYDAQPPAPPTPAYPTTAGPMSPSYRQTASWPAAAPSQPPWTPHPSARYAVPPPIYGASPDPFPPGLPLSESDLPPGWYGASAVDFTVDNPRVIKIPVRLAEGEVITFTEQDVILEDGDIVFIESRDTEIFYTGGLLGGGQYTLPRDYDLDILGAIAIAQAQGQSSGARSVGGISALNHDVTISASRVIILRQLPGGGQIPIEIDLYEALRHPEERVRIQPGDYIILEYTRMEAIAAFIERHLLEGALFGVAAAQLDNRK